MISRFKRRHDKLLREYLDVTRELSDAEQRGSRNGTERLKVRERALLASIRRVRLELGLPETFDADIELAQLRSQERRASRRSRTYGLGWSERPRVRPVPQSSRLPAVDHPAADLTGELVAHAARFCARRAADELLEHRSSIARDSDEPTAAWPARPLARTANGHLYAGSAGRLMGELVARSRDSDEDAERAWIAVRSYVDEFTGWVIVALRRERNTAQPIDRANGDERPDHYLGVRDELMNAAYHRLAVEARAVRSTPTIDADDVAAISRNHQSA